MPISKAVQDAIDAIRENKDLAQSVIAADKVRDSQIADLKAQAADLQSQLSKAPTTQMSTDDLDALLSAVSDLHVVHDLLAGAVPSSVEAPAPVVVPVVDTPAPVAAPVVDAKPQPLPGTGAPVDAPVVPAEPAPAPVVDAPAPPAAIDTPGGFTVSGGGTVQRTPDEAPASTPVPPMAPPSPIS